MKRRIEVVPTISDRIKMFVVEKQAQGLSLSTLENYSVSLRIFMRENSLTGDEPVTALTKEMVQNWITGMIENELNSNSIKHRIRDIRVFYYYLMENEDIPFFKIKVPSLQETEKPKIYSDEELSALLSMPDKKEEYWVWRSWLLTNILIGTGARIGSVCELKKSDITDNTITFNKTKNKKVLTVPLSGALKQAINKYLKLWDIDSDYLLLSSRNGDLLNPHSAIHSFEKYAKLRGVKSLGLHSFRHTFSLQLYKNGTDIVTTQFLLGHSNIEITRKYIGKLTEADLPQYTNPLDRLLTQAKPKIKRKILSN